MEWSELFNISQMPSVKDIKAYIGKSEPIWNELTSFIEDTYNVSSQISYSKCSAQPGWNIKYKKSGKSLCTLYPMEDYFIALIVVGAKEEDEVKMAMDAGMLTPYVMELYQKTAFSAGGRWLMIEVKNKEVLNDIKALMKIRVTPKSKLKMKKSL
jgi:hypothetical protein